jgi:hypothetical protein
MVRLTARPSLPSSPTWRHACERGFIDATDGLKSHVSACIECLANGHGAQVLPPQGHVGALSAISATSECVVLYRQARRDFRQRVSSLAIQVEHQQRPSVFTLHGLSAEVSKPAARLQSLSR